MSGKSSIFLFDRREVLTLGMAMAVALAFAFTMGVHYGKRFGPKGPHGVDPVETTSVPPSADKIPSRLDFSEQGRFAGNAADEELSKAIEAEVRRTGIRLDHPMPVELPEETRSREAGATRMRNGPKAHPESEVVEAPSVRGKFVLQIGSYPQEREAKERLETLWNEGIPGSTRAVNVQGKGTWHRVILGPFPTREEATKVGSRLKSKKLLESYLVAPAGG